MHTGIHLEGGQVSKKGVETVSEAIVLIFKKGAQHNMDQDTIQLALQQLGNLGTVNYTTISGNSVTGK